MKRLLLLVATLALVLQTAIAEDNDLGRRIYSSNASSVLLLYVQSNGKYIAQGSGFLIDGSKIVTNEHVVSGGKVFVELGPARIPTNVEKIDPLNDLAILSVNVEMTVKPLQMAEKKPLPGDLIFAITNPEGLERTISQGVLSANRELSGRKLLQISTPISHGSSGGPIFDRDGQVIGVAVGMFEDGQNLNFAVPIDLVKKLLLQRSAGAPDLESLTQQIASLKTEHAEEKFSPDPDSDYQQKQGELETLLKKGVATAGDNPDALFKVAKLAEGINSDIAIATAQRAVNAKPSSDRYLLLANVLNSKYIFLQGDERESLMKQAETAARYAIKLTQVPTAEMYYRLGDILEDEAKYEESENVLMNIVTAKQSDKSSDIYFLAVRDIILCANELKHPDQEKHWFSELENAGQANVFDWQSHAQHLFSNGEYKAAGDAYSQAATSLKSDWCPAANSYDLASDADSSLAANRKCIDALTGTSGNETELASAHTSIAATLSDRGVYSEALSHAKEATVLDPSNAFAFSVEADALNHLQRFNEAISAANEALKLSDGKYSYMHFTLGSAYFGAENWELARQSFEKAAELDPKDDNAAYNVAICYVRQGYFNDAAQWYEDALKRNPNRDDKDELKRRITALRR